MSHITVNREGRVFVDLTPIYNVDNPIAAVKYGYDYLVVVPFISPYDVNGNMSNLYRNEIYEKLSFRAILNDPNPSDYEVMMSEMFMKFFEEEHFLLVRLNNHIDLLYLLFGKELREDIRNLYTNFNKLTNMKQNLTLRVLYEMLERTSLYVLFVFVYEQGGKLKLGNRCVNDIFNNLDFEDDYDIYVETGLRFNDFRPYYSDISYTSDVVNISRTECDGIIKSLVSKSKYNIFVLDSPVYCDVEDADRVNNSLLISMSNNQRMKVLSLYGWLCIPSQKKLYPPSWLYFLIMNKHEETGNIFDSIVNRKMVDTFGYYSLNYSSKLNVTSYLQEVVSDRIFSIATYVKDGYAIFLSDKNASTERDTLKFEKGVRIAHYVAKVAIAVLRNVIGLELNEEALENLEEDLGSMIDGAVPNDVDVGFVIKDVIEETNTMVTEILVKYGITVYTIKLDVVAKD